jgi:hypothetical protein
LELQGASFAIADRGDRAETLIGMNPVVEWAPMKLLLAIGVLVGTGVWISLGIVLAVKGSPWLLLAGALAYGVAFVRIGCAGH